VPTVTAYLPTYTHDHIKFNIAIFNNLVTKSKCNIQMYLLQQEFTKHHQKCLQTYFQLVALQHRQLYPKHVTKMYTPHMYLHACTL